MELGKLMNSKKTEKVVLGVAVLFCFLVHIVVLRQFTNWYSTDVVGYLSHAATFSGRDWSGVMRNATSYYSWGYSVLLTIPMLLTSNITMVYHCAVLFNALLCCGILLLCYGIGKRIAPELNRYAVILCATAVSVYTSYVFQGAVMLSEIFLYFFVFVNIYCLLRYIETEKVMWGILTGLSVGYTYIIHNRAVAVVVAYVMVAVAWSIKEKSWKRLVIMVAPLVFMLVLNLGVNNYLELHEKQGNAYATNTYESQVDRLTNNISFYFIVSWIKCALGECWYAIVGSFGIIGIGLYGLIEKIISVWKTNSNTIVLYVFLFLMTLGTLMVSILFLFPRMPVINTTRYDIYTYGRYWETVLGILVLIGFLYCFKKIKDQLLIMILVISIFFSVVVEYMTRAHQNNGFNYWAIPAVLTTFFEPEKRYTVLASSIVGILLMVLLFYCFSQRKNAFVVVGVSIWMCFCIFSGYNAISGVSGLYKEWADVLNMPTHNADFNDVCRYIEENEIEQFAVCTGHGYRAVSFQVMNPDAEVTGITGVENWITGKGIYIIDKPLWGLGNYENIIYENGTYLIYVE